MTRTIFLTVDQNNFGNKIPVTKVWGSDEHLPLYLSSAKNQPLILTISDKNDDHLNKVRPVQS